MKAATWRGLPSFRNEDPAPSACPCCGRKLDGATKTHGERKRGPKAGDLSLCVYCGEMLIFADDSYLREPTDEELVAVMLSPVWPEVEAMIAFIKQRASK